MTTKHRATSGQHRFRFPAAAANVRELMERMGDSSSRGPVVAHGKAGDHERRQLRVYDGGGAVKHRMWFLDFRQA